MHINSIRMSDLAISDISESLEKIHECVEKLAHVSKDIYARALRLDYSVNTGPDDLWTQRFPLHERAYVWAKKHMVPRNCSLWQIHEALLIDVKKEGRLTNGNVRLSSEEATILGLSKDVHHTVWKVLSKLPRFFLE